MIFNTCIGWFSLAHEHMKIGFYIIMIAMMAVKNVQSSLHYETTVQPILAIKGSEIFARSASLTAPANLTDRCLCLHRGLVHTRPAEEYENASFTLKTHQMFSVHITSEKFKNATITGHFRFVFE